MFYLNILKVFPYDLLTQAYCCGERENLEIKLNVDNKLIPLYIFQLLIL